MKKSATKSLLAILLIVCMMLTACGSTGDTTTAAPADGSQASGDNQGSGTVDDVFVLKCSY